MLTSRAFGLVVVVSVIFGCRPAPRAERPIAGRELGASTAPGPANSIESPPDAMESTGALSIGAQRQIAAPASAAAPAPAPAPVPADGAQPNVTSPPAQNP